MQRSNKTLFKRFMKNSYKIQKPDCTFEVQSGFLLTYKILVHIIKVETPILCLHIMPVGTDVITHGFAEECGITNGIPV